MSNTKQRDRDNDALAKAIVDELIKQLSGRVVFSTNKYRGATAEVYGDYVTVVDLVGNDEE